MIRRRVRSGLRPPPPSLQYMHLLYTVLLEAPFSAIPVGNGLAGLVGRRRFGADIGGKKVDFSFKSLKNLKSQLSKFSPGEIADAIIGNNISISNLESDPGKGGMMDFVHGNYARWCELSQV